MLELLCHVSSRLWRQYGGVPSVIWNETFALAIRRLAESLRDNFVESIATIQHPCRLHSVFRVRHAVSLSVLAVYLPLLSCVVCTLVSIAFDFSRVYPYATAMSYTLYITHTSVCKLLLLHLGEGLAKPTHSLVFICDDTAGNDESARRFKPLIHLPQHINQCDFFQQVLAVARPVVKWGLMPAVLLMGMSTEPGPTLMDVLYPF